MRATHRYSPRIVDVIFLLLMVLIPPVSQAESTSFEALANKNLDTWFIGAGAGATGISLANSASVINGSGATPPSNQDIYSINNPSSSFVQFLIGYRWHRDQPYLPYYHVFFQYQKFTSADIEGSIDQYSLSDFVNYHYRMSYEANMATINGKFDLLEYKKIMPYLAIGLGVMLNHLNNYSETPVAGVTARISPAFNGITEKKLALSLGLGIDYILTENIWVTLGYEHIFQGNVNSGPGDGSWAPTSLSFGDAKMNAVFLTISANFPQAFRR